MVFSLIQVVLLLALIRVGSEAITQYPAVKPCYCSKLALKLKGGAKDSQGASAGIYNVLPYCVERSTYLKNDGTRVIWYNAYTKKWLISKPGSVATGKAGMRSMYIGGMKMQEEYDFECPWDRNDLGFTIWDSYWDGKEWKDNGDRTTGKGGEIIFRCIKGDNPMMTRPGSYSLVQWCNPRLYGKEIALGISASAAAAAAAKAAKTVTK